LSDEALVKNQPHSFEERSDWGASKIKGFSRGALRWERMAAFEAYTSGVLFAVIFALVRDERADKPGLMGLPTADQALMFGEVPCVSGWSIAPGPSLGREEGVSGPV